MMRTARRWGSALVFGAAAASVTAVLLACGPFLTDLVTVLPIEPAHQTAFDRGQMGVVRPRFARRHLVQAYRRFSGKAPLVTAAEPAATAGASDPAAEWAGLVESTLQPSRGPDPAGRRPVSQFRRIGDDYQSFENCHASAFASAVETLKSRIERWGATSASAQDWMRAQVAVFDNCGGSALVLPEPAGLSADPLLRADRAYQTAAAYFYGTQYEEASRRFRAIAADATSPWRRYGQYLAARAMIRQATVPVDGDRDAARFFDSAEADLNGVLADPSAASLHASARGLLQFIASRRRPLERLRELSHALTGSEVVPRQVLVDYQWLLDGFAGNTVDYEYGSVTRLDELRAADDMTDWILAIQSTGEAALDRALARWNATKATPWLVAVLWKLPAAHPDAAAVLAAAERLERTSPASDTVTFLRVRLLAAQGRRDEARAVLSGLPSTPSATVMPETLNLLNAERFMLAKTFDELLAAAPRVIVVPTSDSPMYGSLRRARSATSALGSSTFDEDAAAVFTTRLPLARLVEAAGSQALPDRLRVRVATAAFTRAWLLGREDEALSVIPRLRALAPTLAADLDRYAAASAGEDRHRAGLLLVLRTPGMHLHVRGIDDQVSYQAADPLRAFDHTFSRNWWCGLDRHAEGGLYSGPARSAARDLLYGGGQVPFPEFLSSAERETVGRELEALSAIGSAPQYLATEALRWARERPADIDAAEALAQVVEGWRWTCPGTERASQLPRRAFETLHRQFPRTEWAKRTKYWYS